MSEHELLDENLVNHPEHWNPNSDEKTLALFSHLGGVAGNIIPFGNILLPLIIWQTQKEKSPFVTHHSKNALNFQITMMIALIISAILIFVIVGIFLVIGIAIFSLVVSIIAAIKASNGENYQYPFSFKFV